MGLAEETGADCYMLVAIRHDGETRGIRILASNWIHDAIELAGSALIAGLAEAAPPTASLLPRCIRVSTAPAMPGVMTGEQARLLDVLGHREIYPLRLSVGRIPHQGPGVRSLQARQMIPLLIAVATAWARFSAPSFWMACVK